MSKFKYIIRKDVFLVDSRKIQGFLSWDQEPKYLKDEEVIKIGLPEEPKKENDIWTPADFLNALLDPYMPRYNKYLEKEYFLYKNFLIKLDLDPSFYRYISKQTRKLKWINNHRSELAYLLLLDILSENSPTVRKANIEYEEDYRKEDRKRQRRLLRNDYYPELFFKTDEYIEIKRDKREKHYSTVLTENLLDFGEEFMPSVDLVFCLNQEFANCLPSQRILDYWNFLSACVKIASADEIQDIINFGDELNATLKRVLLRVQNIEANRKKIVSEIQNRTELVEQFREILNTAIYVRWFNNKTIGEREKLLKKKRRLSYTESEAKKIVPLLLDYYKDPDEVQQYLYIAEQAFKSLNKPNYAELLQGERKKLEQEYKIENA